MTTAAAKTTPEIEVAEEILRPIVEEGPSGVVSEEGGRLIFRLRKRIGWKLATVLFSKEALRKLMHDPNRLIKIDYLRRDILRSATSRREYRYPRNLSGAIDPFVSYSLAVMP